MEHFKRIPPTDRTDRKIVELLRENKYLDAIKFCKEEKNLGLKEAKEDVDSLAASYGIERPKGCGSKAAVLFLIAVVFVYSLL